MKRGYSRNLTGSGGAGSAYEKHEFANTRTSHHRDLLGPGCWRLVRGGAEGLFPDEGLGAGAGGVDVGDADAEVFADFDGVASADGFVVDGELEFFVGGLGQFDDRSGREGEDFADRQLAAADLDDHRDGEVEDGFEVGGHVVFIGQAGRGGWDFFGGDPALRRASGHGLNAGGVGFRGWVGF